ncbi:MAG: IclR family transcriptional regulator, partial [Aquificota bacterium]
SIIAPVYRFSEKKLEFSKEKIVSIAEEITETLSPEFSI